MDVTDLLVFIDDRVIDRTSKNDFPASNGKLIDCTFHEIKRTGKSHKKKPWGIFWGTCCFFSGSISNRSFLTEQRLTRSTTKFLFHIVLDRLNVTE